MSLRLPLLTCAVLLLTVLGGPAHAQRTIDGRVTDADTGTPLPQANLQIEGTYTGTITNAEGRYSLTLDSLPVTVRVRYIGYETAELRITEDAERRQDVALAPSTVELDEVVVTGSENPGRDIMRKVIERKQTWWDSLRTYQVDAYSRYTLSNDSGIVSIYETQTRAFWDRDRGMREVVLSRRKTQNLGMIDEAMPAASTVLNLYQDNVSVAGSELMGVTHPDALDRYVFTLDSIRARNGQKVYDIRVEPTSRLASAFVGRVSVLDSAYAMIEADLRPAESLRLPRVVKNRSVAFEQQFSNFGGPFWLPVDFRAERSFELAFSAFLTIPRIRVDQVSRLSGYEVNGPLPDSLFERDAGRIVERGRIDAATRDTVVVDSLGRDGPYVPLSGEEERAYARRDSAQSLGEAFQPGGLVGSLLDLQASDDEITVGTDEDSTATDSTSTSEARSVVDLQWPQPHLWYNRVEGPHVGGKMTVTLGETVELEGRGGHGFFLDGPPRWSYGGAVETRLPTEALDRFRVSYRYGVEPRYEADARLFPPLTRGLNSLWTLFGEPDYYDYFGNERLRVGLSGSVSDLDVEGRLQFRAERHVSVTEVSDYTVLGRTTFLGRDARQPPNPPIDEGQLRSFDLQLTWGDDAGPRGILPINRVEVGVEHSGEWLGSDFGFTQGEIGIDTRVETFFRRRLLPTTLDLRVEAGGALGTLPLQRFGVIEASPLPYTPFGALRTLDDRPYQGSEYAGLFWEHNFRTVPFEALGLYGLADRHIELILHGGHGRTWIDDDRAAALRQRGIFLHSTDRFHHELGLSVNGLLRDLLRVDVTTRLDRRAVSIGVSVLRFI